MKMPNKEKPLISVIVPIYKVEKYLNKCVKSMINQTYKNFLFLETSMQFSNKIKCDVGANKNAGQAFSMPRLSSHFILYKISAFRLFLLTIRI